MLTTLRLSNLTNVKHPLLDSVFQVICQSGPLYRVLDCFEPMRNMRKASFQKHMTHRQFRNRTGSQQPFGHQTKPLPTEPPRRWE